MAPGVEETPSSSAAPESMRGNQLKHTQQNPLGSTQEFFSNTQDLFGSLLQSSFQKGVKAAANESPRKRKQATLANSPIQEELGEDRLASLIEAIVQEAVRPLQKDIQVLTGLVSTL